MSVWERVEWSRHSGAGVDNNNNVTYGVKLIRSEHRLRTGIPVYDRRISERYRQLPLQWW